MARASHLIPKSYEEEPPHRLLGELGGGRVGIRLGKDSQWAAYLKCVPGVKKENCRDGVLDVQETRPGKAATSSQAAGA